MAQTGTGLIKFCNELAGHTLFQQAKPFGIKKEITMLVPQSHAENPTDTFPTECQEAIETLIEATLPHFKGRQLSDRAMCWCTDTADQAWLMCEDPRWKGLVLATGDSGQTFEMLPVVGKQVVGLIEEKVSSKSAMSLSLRT